MIRYRVINLTTDEIMESDILKPIYKLARSFHRAGNKVILFKGELTYKDHPVYKSYSEFKELQELPII